MKRKILSLIAALALMLSAAATLPGFADAAAVYASANYGGSDLEAYAKQVASIVNRERAANGLSPLKTSDTLNEAAITRAVEIETLFDHERPNGKQCFSVLDEVGVEYYYAGENIAYGQRTPDRVMAAWMNSEGHRNNILNENFEYIGIGVAYNNGTYYWTQFFAGAYNLSGNVVAHITGQPKDVTVGSGETAEFSVTAGGDNLSYQWYYKKADASDWSRWNGHTAATTAGTANASWNGMQVYCTVTDDSGFTVSSNTAVVTVVDKPVIVTQPQDVILTAGEVASFTVKATGENLSYQWYYKKASAADWSKWNGHTDSTTSGSANATWNGMQIYCEVTNGNGYTVSSAPAVITVAEKPVIVTQPKDITLTPGETASFAVEAAGDDLIYQWYYKKSGASSWNKWNGHTAATTSGTANTTWNGMRVYCEVTNGNGLSVNSSTALITVLEKPVITSQPQNITASVGETVSFTVKADGDGLTYQWYYKKADAASWSKWNQHTLASTSAQVNATWNGMQVYCKVTNRSGFSASSAPAVITIVEKPVITMHPQNISAAAGENVSFSVMASGESLGYQWYYKKQGASSWSKWNGHDTPVTTSVANATWNGMQVYCEVSNAAGGKVNSNVAVVTVKANITVTQQPKNVTTSAGKTVTFSVGANGKNLKYQWYFKKSGSSVWSKWKNHTEASTTSVANATWNAMQVYCEITDANGGRINSAAAKITVVDKVKILAQPENVTVMNGQNATFTVKASGSGLTYQWYYKKAGASSWSKWNGHTTASTYATANASWDEMKVFCVVTDSAGNTVSSNYALIYVL